MCKFFSIVLVFLEESIFDALNFEAFALQLLDVLHLLSVLFIELVVNWITRSFETGTGDGLDKIWLSKDFLQHSVAFFLQLKVLLVPVEIASFNHFDD